MQRQAGGSAGQGLAVVAQVGAGDTTACRPGPRAAFALLAALILSALCVSNSLAVHFSAFRHAHEGPFARVLFLHQVDAAWDSAVAALKRVLDPAFSGATAAAQMLTVKDFLLLSCLALGTYCVPGGVR